MLRMNRLNGIFTLASLSVVLVTIERFSFTVKVLLQPYDFLRLHELVQMAVLILVTALVPFLLLREASDGFAGLRRGRGLVLALVFITGLYFYATGNGVHELGSFYYNDLCVRQGRTDVPCSSLFFNDYYTGNVFYFVGAGLMVGTLVVVERLTPNRTFGRGDLGPLVINALVFALTIVAYAGFDRVLVGLGYSLVVAAFVWALFIPVRRRWPEHPILTYNLVAYTLGTLAAIAVRVHP